jgi:hypothetical protein
MMVVVLNFFAEVRYFTSDLRKLNDTLKKFGSASNSA